MRNCAQTLRAPSFRLVSVERVGKRRSLHAGSNRISNRGLDLHHLGSTRSSLKFDHLLQTPDTFIRTPLAGAEGVEFVIHAAPQLGARFTQMTAEFIGGGTLGPTRAQRFLYVLDGGLEVQIAGETHALVRGGYAYLPLS